MKIKPFHKILISVLIVSFVLIITNPSKKNFKEYIPLQASLLQTKQKYCLWCNEVNSAREYNFLIFSIYFVEFKCENGHLYPEDGTYEVSSYKKYRLRFIGVFKNFFYLGKY